MSTVVLYRWYHSDSASVLLYFTCSHWAPRTNSELEKNSSTLLRIYVSQILSDELIKFLVTTFIDLEYPIPGGFHRTFATNAASQQKKLTPPGNWSSHILDLHLF